MTEPRFRVVITDCDFEMPPVIEQAELDPIGAELVVEQCFTEEALIEKVADADGLLEQYAPITARVVDALERCKVIVRYGTGMDPIDVAAATAKGIVVCNVRDYQVGEVADHTMGLLLALARHIVVYNDDVRAGIWDASGRVPERMERVEGPDAWADRPWGRRRRRWRRVHGLLACGPSGTRRARRTPHSRRRRSSVCRWRICCGSRTSCRCTRPCGRRRTTSSARPNST